MCIKSFFVLEWLKVQSGWVKGRKAQSERALGGIQAERYVGAMYIKKQRDGKKSSYGIYVQWWGGWL